MLGMLITAAAGAGAFKLGMEAQKMRAEGKSWADTASGLWDEAVDFVTSPLKPKDSGSGNPEIH